MSHNALVYRRVVASFVPRLMVWVDMNGNEEIVPLEPRPILQPRLSPDGTRVAFTVGERAAIAMCGFMTSRIARPRN